MLRACPWGRGSKERSAPQHGWTDWDGISVSFLGWQLDDIGARLHRTAHPPAGTPETSAEGPLRYWEWDGPGSDAPTIVCVHGLGATHEMWAPVVPTLTRRARVLTVDLPGSGATPLRRRRATAQGAQQRLSELLRTTGHGPSVLMGSSFGGVVCARQAGVEPESALGLVLSSSYLPPLYGGWRAPGVVTALLAEQLGKAGKALRQSWLSPAVGTSPGLDVQTEQVRRSEPPPDHQPSAGARGASRRGHLAAQSQAVASLVAMSLRPSSVNRLYDHIGCPVLVLHGEEDSSVPVEWAQFAQQRRPRWELHTFPGTPHLVKLGDPHWWLRVVEDWLDRLA